MTDREHGAEGGPLNAGHHWAADHREWPGGLAPSQRQQPRYDWPPPDPVTGEQPDAQARDIPLDAHLHTDQSPDADVPVDVYAALALERNVPELAITDHVDFAPGAPAYGFVHFNDRERVVREAAERWAPRGVQIRFGVEITYDSRFEQDIRDSLQTRKYDYAIGSVHVYRDSPYAKANVAAWIDGKSLPEVVAPYFEEVTAAARSGLFDTIGHLDFVKRNLVPFIQPQELTAALELYEPVLRALIDTGAALEVNTSGLRQQAKETYPNAAVVELFRSMGGRRVTAGSDAHRADWLAWGLEEGYRILAEHGYEELLFRRGVDLPQVGVKIPDRFRRR
jgi:histidinol-phosphatase (PHP family)